ncbi:lipoate synthase [Burkholderiales bacterium 8X]|nr:lipoate synthase [Burkholderiales bacterium 8X]
MLSFKGISIAAEPSPAASVAVASAGLRSGDKYVTPQGVTAIRHGAKAGGTRAAPAFGGKPTWTRAPMPAGERFTEVMGLVDAHDLATVCKEARCPNIGECWNAGTATLMLLGSVCTRACRFCAVDTGQPAGRLAADEPARAARTVSLLQLGYVVLTSVNRDDLDDGGATHFAATVRAIHEASPSTAVEVLVPDFRGNLAQVDLLLASGVQVFAQNMETVRRLTHSVRDPRAGYEQTLSVLRHAASATPRSFVKSSLMLGVGETTDEVLEALNDLRSAGVHIVTLGQYLRPSAHHLPVARWVEPGEFEMLREAALRMGFLECLAGPLVRSSYRADQVLVTARQRLAA